MAKIVAAYIAHGRVRKARRGISRQAAELDPALRLSWQRIYCLFHILKQFEAADAETHYILYTDHQPPHIGNDLLECNLKQLGVEIVQCDYYWRPDLQPERPDFFIFDVIEQLAARVTAEDQLLLFGPLALVVHDVAPLYEDINRNDILLVEASVGEVSEPLHEAYRREIGIVREDLKTPNPPDGIMALNPHFLGFKGAQLASVNTILRRVFPKNELRAVRGDAFLSEPGEILAAILAELGFTKSNLKGLIDEIAAMPDEFDIASLPGVPVILPGYGREPDIASIYEALKPTKVETFRQNAVAFQRAPATPRGFSTPMPKRLINWWMVHRSA